MIGFGILILRLLKARSVWYFYPLVGLPFQPQGIKSSLHSFYAVLLASPLLLLTRSRQWQTVGHCPPSSTVDFHPSVGEDHSLHYPLHRIVVHCLPSSPKLFS